MMTTQIQITNTVMKTLTGMVKTSLEDAVKLLSEKYGFDRAEALEYLKVSEIEVVKAKKEKAPKKEKVVVPKKPEFILPWCGTSVAGWCGAIRYNKGLYTQCTQKCKGGSQFCTTCLKHVSDGMPQYGLVSERNNEGWTAPNGKSPVNYANVMDKLKNGDDVVTQEMAVAEAAKFDWTIPEEQFVKTKTRKGRPAKAKAEKTEKKTRGRPKKQKPVTTGGAGDDLIAQLVAQANVQNQQMEHPFTPPSPGAVEEHLDELQIAEGDKQVLQKDPLNAPEEESTDQSEPTTPIDQPTQAVKPDAPKKAKKPRKPKMTEEEKEAAKLAKQQEREAAKLAKQQEREEAKAKAKAEKEAAKAKAKAEKEAAKAAAKAEKKTKKAAAKVETPVESPKEEEEKKATPEQLAQNLDQLELEPESPADLEQDDESEEEEEEVKVETKTGSDGKTYMVDADGNVYDEEGYEIGTWDDEAKAVVA